MSGISPIFLEPREALSIEAIADLCGGHIVPGTSVPSPISVLSSLANPKGGSLTFVQSGAKPVDTSRLESVGAILCAEQTLPTLPDPPAKIVIASPQTAFIKIATTMFPASLGPARVSASEGMNLAYPAASVSSLATIEDGAVIEAGAAIGDHAAVGRNTVIGANAVIADRCQIGRDCWIGPGAVLQYALVGDDVVIHSGAQIGSEGFGFVPGPAGLLKVPQLGRVILQNRVEIGANTTVDRGAIDDTVIGEGTKIDNLVQIAHNVWIGRNCVIAAQTGISGSVKMGDGCMLGGAVGVSDHVTIGSGVQIAASSGVMNDIPDGERWAGTPARPFKEFFREMATLRKLVSADKKPKPET